MVDSPRKDESMAGLVWCDRRGSTVLWQIFLRVCLPHEYFDGSRGLDHQENGLETAGSSEVFEGTGRSSNPSGAFRGNFGVVQKISGEKHPLAVRISGHRRRSDHFLPAGTLSQSPVPLRTGPELDGPICQVVEKGIDGRLHRL